MRRHAKKRDYPKDQKPRTGKSESIHKPRQSNKIDREAHIACSAASRSAWCHEHFCFHARTVFGNIHVEKCVLRAAHCQEVSNNMTVRRLTRPMLVLSLFLVGAAYGQTPSQGKTMNQLMDEALSSQKKEPLSNRLEESIKRSVAAAASASPTPADQDLCQPLLKAPIEKYLPKGYSNPRISPTDMTAAERSGGMRCKISVLLQGPDRFDAIRFRVYEDTAAATRGLKSLAKLLPADATLISEDLSYNDGTISSPGRDSPCMVFTAGDRTQTFVSCADQLEGTPVVVSGIASEPRAGNSFDTNTSTRAGKLLKAGMANYRDMALDRAFGKGEKK